MMGGGLQLPPLSGDRRGDCFARYELIGDFRIDGVKA